MNIFSNKNKLLDKGEYTCILSLEFLLGSFTNNLNQMVCYWDAFLIHLSVREVLCLIVWTIHIMDKDEDFIRNCYFMNFIRNLLTIWIFVTRNLCNSGMQPHFEDPIKHTQTFSKVWIEFGGLFNLWLWLDNGGGWGTDKLATQHHQSSENVMGYPKRRENPRISRL